MRIKQIDDNLVMFSYFFIALSQANIYKEILLKSNEGKKMKKNNLQTSKKTKLTEEQNRRDRIIQVQLEELAKLKGAGIGSGDETTDETWICEPTTSCVNWH